MGLSSGELDVGAECSGAAGCVEEAGGVAKERLKTVGCVGVAGGEAEERTVALCRVAAGITSIRRWNDGLRCWRKREGGEQECDER